MHILNKVRNETLAGHISHTPFTTTEITIKSIRNHLHWAMTKSELIEKIASKQNNLPYRDVGVSVKTLLEQMSGALASGGRIEIRGFGSFSVRARSPRVGRNPRTGELVPVPERLTPHFKPGKELRKRVNGFGNT